MSLYVVVVFVGGNLNYEIMKYAFLVVFSLLCAPQLLAQDWTVEDSLRLNRMMVDDEIKLNLDAVRSIDMESGLFADPVVVADKQWLKIDASLPLPNNETKPFNMREMLSLRPYKAGTPMNWDPVYRKRIKMGADTWRSDPFYKLSSLRIYSGWARRMLDAGPRNTLEQIEATGLRYNPLAGRVNNQMVGAWTATPSGVGGLDFNYCTSKEFWDFQARRNRIRTLEVLSQYGDSTTVQINHPIFLPLAR